jgi:predicted dehydrogenase
MTATGADAAALARDNERRTLGVAVVGVGFVGAHHVDAARRTGYADVRALVGPDQARIAARAADLGVPFATTDLDAVLGDGAVDVIHICTPNDTHVELAARALEGGMHVVVEKPLGQDIAAAAELDELARRHERHAMVAFTYRGYPMVRRARALVESGALGSVHLVEGRYLQDWLATPSDYNWRVDAVRGGRSRAVADIGCHVFDTVEWVSGSRVESVVADLPTFVPVREHAGRRLAVASEDAAGILVRFDGGATGSFFVSQVSPARKNAFTFELAGSERSLAWNQEQPNSLWTGTRESIEIFQRGPDDGWDGTRGVPALPPGHPEGWSDALRDLLRPFYAAVDAGAPPSEDDGYPTLADGIRAMAFVDAVIRSAEERTWVRLGDHVQSKQHEGGRS